MPTRRKKPVRHPIDVEEFRVFDPPEADYEPLCRRHYEAWRDGERSGPAVVVDMQDTGEHGCARCRVESPDKES